MSLLKSDDFNADVERQFEWYAVNAGWEVADRYLTAVETTVRLLEQHPQLGPRGGFQFTDPLATNCPQRFYRDQVWTAAGSEAPRRFWSTGKSATGANNFRPLESVVAAVLQPSPRLRLGRLPAQSKMPPTSS